MFLYFLLFKNQLRKKKRWKIRHNSVSTVARQPYPFTMFFLRKREFCCHLLPPPPKKRVPLLRNCPFISPPMRRGPFSGWIYSIHRDASSSLISASPLCLFYSCLDSIVHSDVLPCPQESPCSRGLQHLRIGNKSINKQRGKYTVATRNRALRPPVPV